MTTVSDAIALGLRAGKRRAMAEACHDPIRRSFELDLACDEETQATTLLMPLEPLQKGVGGEILPSVNADLNLTHPAEVNLTHRGSFSVLDAESRSGGELSFLGDLAGAQLVA